MKLNVVGAIEQVNEMEGERFHREYLQCNRPVLLKGLARGSRACVHWVDDTYLLELAGNEPVWPAVAQTSDMAYDHRSPNVESTMGEFLSYYRESSSHYVNASDLPESLLPDLPQHEIFEAFETLEDTDVETGFYLADGDRFVQPHYDDEDNLFTLVSGSKTFYLSDPTAFMNASPCNDTAGPDFTSVDVLDDAKLTASSLAHIVWYKAEMEPGDVLFIPGYWWHAVASSGRHMAITKVRLDRLTQVLATIRLVDGRALPVSDAVYQKADEIIKLQPVAAGSPMPDTGHPLTDYLSLGIRYRDARLSGAPAEFMEEMFDRVGDRHEATMMTMRDHLPMLLLLQNLFRMELGIFDE